MAIKAKHNRNSIRHPISFHVCGIDGKLTKKDAIELKTQLQAAIDALFLWEYGRTTKYKAKRMKCPKCEKDKMWLDKGTGWKCLGCYAGPYMVTDTDGGFVEIKSNEDDEK